MTAPERIWIDTENTGWWADAKEYPVDDKPDETDVLYIRADAVIPDPETLEDLDAAWRLGHGPAANLCKRMFDHFNSLRGGRG